MIKVNRVNKHKVLQNWVQQFLDGNYLYFESASAYPDVRAIVPNYGDYTMKTDIVGNKYKTYTFLFIAYEQLDIGGTSDVNTDNMALVEEFNYWLEEQEANHNYPDFGPKCKEYSIEILQNMPNLATVEEDGLAKYVLGATINYLEEE